MRVRAARLGWWWLFALVLAGGLAMATLGRRMLVGGVLMAVAFVLAAALRAFRPQYAGGLRVRSLRFDVWLWLGLAALVLAAFLAVDLGPVRR